MFLENLLTAVMITGAI